MGLSSNAGVSLHKRLFICHASADAAAAGALTSALEAAGAACWISSRDVAAGQNFQEAIVHALRAARGVVFLLTDAANRSAEVRKELALASSFAVPVLPIRHTVAEPTEALRYELATRQWIEPGSDHGVAAILAALHDAQPAPPPLALPDKPSLVVLPFANVSPDPEQDYFVDGLVEDITTALSCIRSLFVIARSSASTYKGRAVDARHIGRELGVRYILEGSVRKAANRIRFSGQLVEAATGAQLWAERFDGPLDDIFDLQDRITASVAGAIEPTLQQAEITRAQAKPTQDLGAYDYFLRAVAMLQDASASSLATIHAAQALFLQAARIDPGYGAAYGGAAMCVYLLLNNNHVVRGDSTCAEGIRLANQAAAKGWDDALTLTYAGSVLMFVAADLEAGERLLYRACTLNPNSALAWARAGWNDLYKGHPDVAIEKLERAIRLSPRGRNRFFGAGVGIARAHFNAGRYDQALICLERLSDWNERSLTWLRLRAAAYAMAGRQDDAARAVADLLAAFPAMSMSALHQPAIAWRRADDHERWLQGLRRAGLPE